MNISAARLHAFVVTSLTALDVPAADAAVVADSYVEAELKGQSGHGVIRLPFVLKRLSSGLIDPRPAMRIVSESGSAALLDGGNGLGPVVGTRAIGIAFAKARATGVGLCTSRRSNHLGAVGFYVQRVAAEGLIALGFSNTPPAMAPPGGVESVLGTNPIAAAFPTEDEPVIVDLATSQVARGRILKAAQAHEPIPPDWAVDSEGNVTTDPAAALKGSLRPLGGAKGFALALVVESLSGVLSGSAVGPQVGGTYLQSDSESDVGHTFVVIDPAVFSIGFAARMGELAGVIRAVKPLDPDKPVRLPGDRRRAEFATRMRDGIELPDHVVKELESATGDAL